MFPDLEARLVTTLERVVAERFGITVKVALEQPKQSAFGELAIPLAFQLARQLKRAPKQIAEELAGALGTVTGLRSLEIAGNGYINLRIERDMFVRSLLAGAQEQGSPRDDKIIVEHTNINPNKAAHIGHLRNAVLGDTFVRILRDRGRRVEVQNYIDNTGVQVADVVVAFHYLEKKSLADVEALINDPAVRFDYLCWDLYARISAHYLTNQEALQWRAHTLHEIESGIGSLASLAHKVADAIVQKHLATMYRLNVTYELLPRESEILHLKFWAHAFELLKQKQAIYFETVGKNASCWVMPSERFRQGASAVNEEDSKVIVRSNGTVTYVGKDIAYQLWKFGLLGKDFHYRVWSSYPDGAKIWVSTDNASEPQTPAFGGASEVYNVIDSRQSYLQDVVVAGLEALGFEQQAAHSVHFSYEMVALTPRTCAQLGIELSAEDQRKSYVEVSGRKGLGVKADDLIDKLIETALREVEDRHPEAPAGERVQVATQIAVGALRYFMLKFTRNSVIAFDFQEALSFEGETGPYVQYAAVRATNILRKYEERGGSSFTADEAFAGVNLAEFYEQEDLWQLMLLAGRTGDVLERAMASGEPANVAKYAFQLAQGFNNFYHEHSVLNEEDVARKKMLLWTTQYVRGRLLEVLDVLGIEQPAYM